MRQGTEGDSVLYKTSKFDLVLIGFIVLFAAFSILWINHSRGRLFSGPGVAVVYIEDRLSKKIALKEDKIVNVADGKMQLEVKQGKIRVAQSDCPRRICVNMGWIQQPGGTIACVPNKVLIEIKSKGPAFLDAVVY